MDTDGGSRHFVFGYGRAGPSITSQRTLLHAAAVTAPVRFAGSIINNASRARTTGEAGAALLIRVKASFQHVRSWSFRAPTGFTAVGLQPADDSMPPATVNGILVEARRHRARRCRRRHSMALADTQAQASEPRPARRRACLAGRLGRPAGSGQAGAGLRTHRTACRPL